MTRIAVLADIHGNIPALDAVIKDIHSQAPDEVLVGGDLVGRGPQGDAVIRRIAQEGWRCVRGNHEDYMLGFRRREVPQAWWSAEEWSAARWMAAELSEEAVAYIDALPFSITSAAQPDLVLCHGTPRSHSEGLGAWSADALLSEHLRAITGSLLVCAHTHRPMSRVVPEGMVVNTGSVGMPFNGDTRAQYVILERHRTSWRAAFRQVEYDLRAIFEVYDRVGFLEEGGVTATLLRLELEHARPFLVPFLKWAELTERAPHASNVNDFLNVYDPEQSSSAFFKRFSKR